MQTHTAEIRFLGNKRIEIEDAAISDVVAKEAAKFAVLLGKVKITTNHNHALIQNGSDVLEIIGHAFSEDRLGGERKRGILSAYIRVDPGRGIWPGGDFPWAVKALLYDASQASTIPVECLQQLG